MVARSLKVMTGSAAFDAGGQFQIDRLAVAQRDPLRLQGDRVDERHHYC